MSVLKEHRVVDLLPRGVGRSPFLLPRGIDVNQGEILDDLLHLLELEQSGEAALTCRGEGRKEGRRETGKRKKERKKGVKKKIVGL